MDVLDDIDADIHHFDEIYPSVNESIQKQYYSADEFNSKFSPNCGNDLSVFHINIRSLNKNGDELLVYLETINRKFDVICITESWITELPVVDDVFPSYPSFHSIRKSKNGGGCSLYINKKFKA